MFQGNNIKKSFVLFLITTVLFITFINIGYTQSSSTKDTVRSAVKGVLSSQKNPNMQIIGLGSWISGGNYKDPLNPNFKVPSDHDLRIVVPKGTPDDEAIALWKTARENLRESILQKFGPEKGKKILKTINVYPPDQLVKGINNTAEAENLFLNQLRTNPNLADEPIEGLFKDSSKGWKQAYEAKKGRAFYYDPKTGNVVTTSPDLIHLEEGYGKITMGGMAETADDWIEHLDDALKKKDPLATKKYLERLDASLKKSKDLGRISHDDYLAKVIEQIDDEADELSDELIKKINTATKQAKFESKALKVLSKGGYDKYGRIIAGILEKNNPKWVRFKNAIGTIADNVPVDTLLQGVFVAFDSYQSYEAYKDGNYEDAYRQAFAAALSNVGLSVAIPAALTNAIIEDAKENGYILMVSRQDCEGLLVGECNMIGRTQVLQKDDKAFTAEFDKIIADKNPKTEAEFDSIFGPIIQYNARKCADRGFNGVITDFVDSKVGDACWARCSKVLKEKWNKARVGKIAEIAAMGDQYKQEFHDSSLNISYEPDPILLPEDPKAPQQVLVTFSGDFSGNESYMSKLFKDIQDIIAKKAPNYNLTGLVTYKWFVDGQVVSTVNSFIISPNDPVLNTKEAVLKHQFNAEGKHHITLKFTIKFRYSTNHPDVDVSDSIYKELDNYCKNLLMIKDAQLDIEVKKPKTNPQDPDTTNPDQPNPDQNQPDNQKPDDQFPDNKVPGVTEPKTSSPQGDGNQSSAGDNTQITPDGKTLADHIKEIAIKSTKTTKIQVNTTSSNTQNTTSTTSSNTQNTINSTQTNNPCSLYKDLKALKEKLDNQIRENDALEDKVNNDRIDIQNNLSKLYDTKVGSSTLRNIGKDKMPEPYRSSVIELSDKLNNIQDCRRNLNVKKNEILEKKWVADKKLESYIDMLLGCEPALTRSVNVSSQTLDEIKNFINNTNANYNQYVLVNNCSTSTTSPKISEPDNKPASNMTCGNKNWEELYDAYISTSNDNEKSTVKGCIDSQYAKIPPLYEEITNKYKNGRQNLNNRCDAFKKKIETQIKANDQIIEKLSVEYGIAYKNKEYGKAKELNIKASKYRLKNEEITKCAEIPNARCSLNLSRLRVVVSGREWWKPQLNEKESNGLPTRKAFIRYDQDKGANVEEDIKKHDVEFNCDSLCDQAKGDNEEDQTKVIVEVDKTKVQIGETVKISAKIQSKKGNYSCSQGLSYEWKGQNIGSGGDMKSKSNISFVSSKPGKFSVEAKVSCGTKALGSNSVSIEVEGSEITGKISGLTGPIYYGSKKSINYSLIGEPESKVPRQYKVLWQSSPNLKFDPQESSAKNTTVTFDRMSNPTKIWADIDIEGEDTSIKLEQQELEVVAPEFTFKFTPAAGEGKIGQPVKVQITATPAVENSLIDYRWIEPTDRKEISNGVIEIIPKDNKPIKLHVNARVPGHGDTIKDDITSEYTASDVKVTAKVIGVKYDSQSQEWQNGSGLVNKNKSFVVDQDIMLGAEVEGYKKEDIKFSWSVTGDSCHIVAGQISDQVTMNKSEPGSCEAKVVANNKNSRKLGEASVSFSVVSQDDENLTKPIIEKAKKLVAEGKLDEAIGELAAGLTKFPNSKALKEYHKELTDQKTKVLQNISNLKTLAGQFKFNEAEVELNTAKALHPKYYPIIEAEKFLKAQKSNYITQELSKAKQKVLQCTLDEAGSTVDNILKADSTNQTAQALSIEIKDKKAKINSESEKIKTLLNQNQIDEAEKALELAMPICSTDKTFAELKKQIDEKRKGKRDEIIKKLAEAKTALDNKEYQQAIDIVAQIKSDYQKDLIQQDTNTLNTIESQAKKALEDRQKALDVLKEGENYYNNNDLEPAISKFNAGLDTYANVWSSKDTEPAKYKVMRDEAKAKLAQVKSFISQSKALSTSTETSILKAITLIDKALNLYPNSKEANDYKKVLKLKLAELQATKQTTTTNTNNSSNGYNNSSQVPAVPQLPGNNVVPIVPVVPNMGTPPVSSQMGPIYSNNPPQVPNYSASANQVPIYNNPVPQVPIYSNPVNQVPIYNNAVPQVPVYPAPNSQQTTGYNSGNSQPQNMDNVFDSVISQVQTNKSTYNQRRNGNNVSQPINNNQPGLQITYDTGDTSVTSSNGSSSSMADRLKTISAQTLTTSNTNRPVTSGPCTTPCNKNTSISSASGFSGTFTGPANGPDEFKGDIKFSISGNTIQGTIHGGGDGAYLTLEWKGSIDSTGRINGTILSKQMTFQSFTVVLRGNVSGNIRGNSGSGSYTFNSEKGFLGSGQWNASK